MAMVDAMPVPDSRQKVDELFLFWLSEPSTQELLRNELTKVCRYGGSDGVGSSSEGRDSPNILDSLVQSPASSALLANVPRSSSPGYRTPSPPLHLSNSPKSPRAKRRAKSPRRNLTYGSAAAEKSNSPTAGGRNLEEVDYFPSPAAGPSHLPAEHGTTSKRVTAVEAVVEQRGKRAHHHEAKQPTPATAPTTQTIPRFFYPEGKQAGEEKERVDQQLKAAGKVFHEQDNGEVSLTDFHLVVKAMELPLYWKAPLFRACQDATSTTSVSDSGELTTVTFTMLRKTWLRVTRHCHDDPARFVKLMATEGRSFLTETDFEPLIQDIVDTHPGLAFLASAPEFHARYVETVIGRIFYSVDRSWNNRITVSDLRRSDFLHILQNLENEQDINTVTEYFSYEHFYVIYCKFWELDTDHDLVIDAQDLSRHADHALTPLVIDRVTSGIVSRDRTVPAGKLSYKDFVWFLLSEEDKTTQRSIEYWFRCLDVDGDGVLSLYEMQLFYEEVLQRLRELNIESLSVENTVCQVLDMIKPCQKYCIRLSDLKSNKLTPAFLNTFINVEKYLDYEQRDMVTMAREETETPSSDWDRYAAEQYEILLAEEVCENDNSTADEDTTYIEDSELGEEEREMLALL